MSTRAPVAALPGTAEIDAAVAALPEIREFLRRHVNDDTVALHVSDDEDERTLTVPRAVVDLMAEILHNMAQGRGVSVVPATAELTTQQAADMLNVSRPFLIGLLTSGEIAYRKVGTHRRIKVEDLLAYKAADDRRRRENASELTALGQEMELY